MSVKWPDRFPAPTLQGYSVKPDESIARTKMDSGLARQRRRFTSTPSKVNVRWMMNLDNFGLFESWYKYKAKEGAEWVVMQLNNGLGFESYEVRFLKPYAGKMLSDTLWEVSANLEVRNMAVLSEKSLDFILGLGLAVQDIQLGANRLHRYIHTEKSTIFIW